MSSPDRSIPLPLKPRPKRQVTRHRVRKAIERMILTGRCRAGTKLVQEDFAKRLGVARGVVREAILELRGTGLVETVDNRGMFVAPLSNRKLLESYDVREVNEGLAARLCATRITPAQIEELRVSARRIHEMMSAGRTVESGRLDRALHHTILRIADNRELLRIAQQFPTLGKMAQFKSSPDATLATHLELIDALASGDPERAERAAREHIRSGRRYVEQQIAEGRLEPTLLVDRTTKQDTSPFYGGRI